MAEVTITLPGRSVYLNGEVITCEITFTNKPTPRKDGSPIKNKPIKLAWASAQIHCQCTVNESKITYPRPAVLSSEEVGSTTKETSFIASRGEKGHCLLATQPVILFCDITLMPGETRNFTYKQALPQDCPPSFRGSAIKYSYKVTIGAQRLRHPTRLIRVPFRVLVVPGLHNLGVYKQEEEELKPTNPFLKSQQKEENVVDVAMEILQMVTCRRANNYYNITVPSGKVAKFCLFKQAYRIGDDIIGICDFTEGTVPCVQFSVTLQSEEIISEHCQKKGTTSPGMTITSYSRHQEFCLHTSRTNISVPIPLTAAPEFISDLVCLKWRLHFEFTTSKDPLEGPKSPTSPSESSLWQGPAELHTDAMIWDLPIKVFATSPIHADSVSLLKTKNSLVI